MRLSRSLLLTVLLLGLPTQAIAAWATPPAQPAQGPGGKDYAFDRVRVTEHGKGAQGYWLFEPVGAGDAALPVVVFVHGFNQVHYRAYDLWIRHLVRKGSAVIYPRYQAGVWLDPRTFTAAAAHSIREGLSRLDGKRHVKADRERVSMVGHSLGGVIIANLAARSHEHRLPQPKALMLLQPGDVRAKAGLGAFFPSILDDYSAIPKGTLLMIVAVEGDHVVGKAVSERILAETAKVPDKDKDLLVLDDDTHGRPALFANHFTPLAYTDGKGRKRVDAYDFAMWRWFDALSATAYGDLRQRKIALGGTADQLNLGQWSSGRPVRRPQIHQP